MASIKKHSSLYNKEETWLKVLLDSFFVNK